MTDFHLSNLIHQQADNYEYKVAFRHKDDITGSWIATTWREFSNKTQLVAKAFAHLELKECENVAICSQNKPEILISEFALYANRAVSVPLFAASSVDQIEYIINEAEISLLLVGEQAQYDTAFPLLQKNGYLKRIIVFDSRAIINPEDTTTLFFHELLHLGEISENEEVIANRTLQAHSDDLANLIYTSGTTGVPKGVMITHANYIEAMRIHDIRLYDTSDQDISVCFLPLSHIFEKTWSYFCLFKGVQIEINLNPADIQKTLQEVRPTIMCSVPRLWEKVYAGIQEKIEKATTIDRFLMRQALRIGKKRNLTYERTEKKAPLRIELPYLIFDKLIFQKLKKAVGIENGNFFPVAGAPLSNHINEFFHACDIQLLYGYGLTETTASVSCFFKKGYTIGSVGVEMPGVEVKIGENNEIMVKGKTVMKGYYKKPEETALVLTEDGWFKTGDAGAISENGVLTMTERIKDLMKTSNGKYVAPQALELRIGEDKFIDQIAVIGDERQYITALIIPAYDALKEYAKINQIHFHKKEDLTKNSHIHQMIVERIDELQKNFAKYEQIKRISLLAVPFSLDGGELTNTLKLRRGFIVQRYKTEIEEMYR